MILTFYAVLSHCVMFRVKVQIQGIKIKALHQCLPVIVSSSARLHPLPAFKGPCEASPAGDAGPASSQLCHRGHSAV